MNLKLEVAPYFHQHFNNLYPYEIQAGGRASTKTSYMATKLLVSKNGILANKNIAYVVLRKHGNKIRNSIFKEFLKIINRLGVPKTLFKIKVSPFEITYLPNNSSLYFTGIEVVDDVKGTTTENQEIKGVLFEEMTEIAKTLEDIEDIINGIIATFVRGTDVFSFMGTFNPPKQRIAPINTWVEKYKKRTDFVYMKTNVYMLSEAYIKRWKLELTIKEAKNLKEIDKDLHDHVYLAEEITPQNATYPNYKTDFIVSDLRGARYTRISVGVDTGASTSSNVFIATGIVGFYEEFHAFKEFEWNNNERGFLNSQDRIVAFFEFCKAIWFEHKIMINAFIESADMQFYKDLILHQKQFSYGFVKIQPVNKAVRMSKSSSAIEERIETEIKMIGSNRLKIDKSCVTLDKAFQVSERDARGRRLDDATQMVDQLDAFEYSWLHEIVKINENIIAKGKLQIC